MNKLWALLKVQLLTFFGINKALHGNDKDAKKKTIFTVVLLVSVSILIIAMSTFYSLVLAFALIRIDRLELLIAIMMTGSSLATLFTTIYKTRVTLFGFKDYDIVMSMPVKTKTVVRSRMVMIYLMNIAFSLVLMVPAGIVYGVFMSVTFKFYLLLLLLIFFIPLIPSVIGTIIGVIIALVSSLFRHKNLFETFITFGIIIGAILLSYDIKGVGNDFTKIGPLINEFIYNVYPVSSMFVDGICKYNIWSIILFIAGSSIMFSLFIFIISTKYKTINSTLTSSKVKSNFKLGALKRYPQFEALYYKEVKRYFSSTLYIVNTSFGLIMLLLFAIGIAFLDTKEIETILELPGFSDAINSLLPLCISLFVAMTCTSVCSISLEGKNLWILISSPVTTKSIFLSKASVNITITLPIILFTSTLFGIYLKPSIINWILIYLTPIVYSIFISIMGIIVNLKFPKLDWTTEIVVIKQSMATFIALVIGIASVILPFSLTLIFSNISKDILMIIITCIISIITFSMYLYLKKEGEKLFKKLNE